MIRKKDIYTEIISDLMSTEKGISCRAIKSEVGDVNILFIKEITDIVLLSTNIINPLMKYISENKSNINSEVLMNQAVSTCNCYMDNGVEKVFDYLLKGMTLIFSPNDNKFLVINIKRVEKKNISDPELTYTIRGPKDCFTENLDVNISLIRYRIKDQALKTEMFEVGRRTKTRVAMIYISNISYDKVSNLIRDRINNIDTDGIIESGELQKELLNNKFSLFPQMGLAERSDMAAGAILEGKVVVIAEGSGISLIAPKTFGEFFWSCDDLYDNQYIAFLSKILRIIAAFFSISLTSLFIIVSSFQHDILPPEYIITLATSRGSVPWNAFTGVLLLEIVLEILREALLRVPKQIGSAIGVVGGIIIGQAAIVSGVWSPLLLILAALSLMSSFVMPDYTIANSLRISKFMLIFITGILDLYGFTMGLCFLMTNIISTNSFGVPYFAPFAPFNWSDIKNTLYYNKKTAKNRPHFLKTKDSIRTKE